MDRLEAKSTVLSILHGTTAEDAATRATSLRRLCEQYTAPLVAYLHVSRRIPLEDAEDLVNEFWTQKLLVPSAHENIVAKYFQSSAYGPTRGFRKFIFRSVANFQLDHVKKIQRRGKTLSLEQLEGWQPTSDGLVDPEFDRIWARHILGQVVDIARGECELKGQQDMWRLFVACISQPLNNTQRSMSELAVLHGFDNAKQASAALITVSRKFDRLLKSLVANYLPGQETTEENEALIAEVNDLREILSRPGVVNVESLGLLENPGEPAQMNRGETDGNLTCLNFSHNRISHSDLTSLWQALLEQRLLDWLPEFSGPIAVDWHSLRFGDLANWANPHLELLRMVHQYSKRQGTSSQETAFEFVRLPKEFFSVIYLTAIAVSYLQFCTHLSKASRSQLVEWVDAAALFPWLDSRTRELLVDFQDNL